MAAVRDREAFERILDGLYDAMLDDTLWQGVSAAVDEACGLTGNGLLVRGGPADEGRVLFVGTYCRGEYRAEQERDYLENYHPTDERVPRVRELPDSCLTHSRELYTAEERKSSATYNEMLPRMGARNSLNVRLEGPDGSSIVWFLLDPVDSEGWDGPRVAMVTRLLPHVRQFVRVRQAMAAVEGRARTLAGLLDDPRIGIIQLDRRRQIVEANDRARSILRHGDGLSDRHGMLRARVPADQVRLERLLDGALPALDAPGVSGSMLLRRSSVLRPFVVHVKPVSARQADYEARRVAALMLIAEPGPRRGITPELVATTLELTRAESRVAVWLAEGKNVREMAAAGGNTEDAIYWHLKRIYRKHSLSGQADLVRLVLSLPELD